MKKVKKAIVRYWRLILFVLVIVGVVYVIFWSVKKFVVDEWSGGEVRTYQVLAAVYDEKNSDPIEDKKSSMKKGYVIGVYEENHEWSETEKVSYLILKMSLNEKEVDKITQPIQKKIDIKTLTEEQQQMMKEEKNAEVQKETVSARQYKIDLEKIGFSDPNALLQGQPFEGKIFDFKIVTKI